MLGSISDEIAVKVPAAEAWKLYSSLQLSTIAQEALSAQISKVEVVEGDGGVGTILELFLRPGTEGEMKSYKEKFTVVDSERRVKEVEVVEGGYLDQGFALYRIRLEVIEVAREKDECITRCTVEYELKEGAAAATAALASIEPFTAIMQHATDYLHRNYNPSRNI